MSAKFQKLKSSRFYGFFLLGAMLAFFYAVFKILTPNNFGSLDNLYSYLQSSIIYSVGGCGLYFINLRRPSIEMDVTFIKSKP